MHKNNIEVRKAYKQRVLFLYNRSTNRKVLIFMEIKYCSNFSQFEWGSQKIVPRNWIAETIH